jgi:hypothetical protein
MKTLSPRTRRLSILLTLPAVLAMFAVIAAIDSHTVTSVSAAPPKKARAKQPPVTFNDDGELVRPTGYRKWTYVGTPVTPNDMNGGNAPFPEFHSVYMNRFAFNRYEKTGKFPDGTVLVKELVSVGSKEASSGEGYFMGEFIGLEVSVKDKKRFADEPGYWAYFSFGHKYPLKETAKAQATSSCNECHDGEADEDFVFTQYYPVLRAAGESAAK